MLGIRAIASYIPERRESNLDLLTRFDIDENFVSRKIGVLERAIKREDESTSDMAFKALQALFRKASVKPDEIQALVLVTQNPDTNLPHASAIVHGLAGLPNDCAVFDVSLGCSGYVYGLSVLLNFLRGNGMSTGILITCDPYSTIIDPSDKNTVLLFGDAATATLVSHDPNFGIGPFAFGSDGTSANSLACSNGILSMNGREVFNFAATVIPGHVEQLLAKAGLEKADIDGFYFHQGSRFIVETLAKRLALENSKVRLGLQHVGNTVSSSIPLLLEDVMHNEETKRLLLCGFGVGLSWASCILSRC